MEKFTVWTLTHWNFVISMLFRLKKKSMDQENVETSDMI